MLNTFIACIYVPNSNALRFDIWEKGGSQVIQSDNRYRQEPIGSVSDSNRNPMKSDGNLINRQNPIGFLVAIRHLDPWGRI